MLCFYVLFQCFWRLKVEEQVKRGEMDRVPIELLVSNICYGRLCWWWRLLSSSAAWNFCFRISLRFCLREFFRRKPMKIYCYSSDVVFLKYWGKTEVCIKSLSEALPSMESGLQKSPLQNTSFFFLLCILFLKMVHMHIIAWKHSLFEMSMAVFFVGWRLTKIESRKEKCFSNDQFNFLFLYCDIFYQKNTILEINTCIKMIREKIPHIFHY